MDIAADPALDSIEASILTGISLLLDGLIDSAMLAIPGVDSAVFAAELRSLAGQTDDLARRVSALAPAQAPERERMSA